jgi:hypothetical protein
MGYMRLIPVLKVCKVWPSCVGRVLHLQTLVTRLLGQLLNNPLFAFLYSLVFARMKSLAWTVAVLGWVMVVGGGQWVVSASNSTSSNATAASAAGLSQYGLKLGEGTCYISLTAIPFQLTTATSCPQHYFCPNVSAENPMSSPDMCPPSLECQIKRLSNIFCEPQGIYEPQVCLLF